MSPATIAYNTDYIIACSPTMHCYLLRVLKRLSVLPVLFLKNQCFVLPVLLTGTISFACVSHAQIKQKTEVDLPVNLTIESRMPDHADSIWHSFHDVNAEPRGFKLDVTSTKNADLATTADVLELTLHDAKEACERGGINLLPLDKILPADTDLSDFVWNGIQPCAIGHSVRADIGVFDTTRYTDSVEPTSLEDFFNTELFPGKRALKRSPQVLAEWSLMMSGVPRDEVYQALGSNDAWAVIEETLEELLPNVLWVETDSEALALLDSDAASFALVSSQNLVHRIVQNIEDKRPYDHYGALWKNAVAHMSLLAIPKRENPGSLAEREAGSNNLIRFLRFVSDPYRNLQLSTASGYAPVSLDHADLIDIAYRVAMPLAQNGEALFWGNTSWWRDSGEQVEASFMQFIEKSFTLETALNEGGLEIPLVKLSSKDK